MSRRILVLVALMIAASAVQVHAFDGQRKGFILGGGVGYGFLSNKFSTDFSSGSETLSEGVFQTDFKIGYAPQNDLEVFYVAKGAWWSDSFTFLLSSSAIGVSKFLGGEKKWFITGGVGLSALDAPFEDGATASTGFSLSGGGGYEFARHWTIGADVFYSNISDDGIDLNSVNIRATINILGY